MPRHVRLASLLVLAIAVARPAAAPAEEIVLASGRKIEGRIVEETADKVVVEVAAPGGGVAQLTFPRGEVVEIRRRPLTHDELIARGSEHLQNGHLDAARSAFEEARLALRGSPEAYHGLARVEWRRGDFALAIKEARKGIILQRDHPELHRTIGLLYAEVGDFAMADRMLQRAIALKPFSQLETLCKQDLARIHQMAARAASGDPLLARRRRGFDAEEGNNFEAGELARFAERVVDNLQPQIARDFYVEVRAEPSAEFDFRQGGPEGPYRAAVQIVQFSIVVHPADWGGLTHLERKEMVGAWIRFAKDRYPFATVIAVVHNTERIVFEAVWSDLRHDVIFHERRASDS